MWRSGFPRPLPPRSGTAAQPLLLHHTSLPRPPGPSSKSPSLRPQVLTLRKSGWGVGAVQPGTYYTQPGPGPVGARPCRPRLSRWWGRGTPSLQERGSESRRCERAEAEGGGLSHTHTNHAPATPTRPHPAQPLPRTTRPGLPTPTPGLSCYLHRIQARRLRLPPGLASSLEEKRRNPVTVFPLSPTSRYAQEPPRPRLSRARTFPGRRSCRGPAGPPFVVVGGMDEAGTQTPGPSGDAAASLAGRLLLPNQQGPSHSQSSTWYLDSFQILGLSSLRWASPFQGTGPSSLASAVSAEEHWEGRRNSSHKLLQAPSRGGWPGCFSA